MQTKYSYKIFGMKNVPEEILSKITPLLQKGVSAGTNVIKQHDVGDPLFLIRW